MTDDCEKYLVAKSEVSGSEETTRRSRSSFLRDGSLTHWLSRQALSRQSTVSMTLGERILVAGSAFGFA